MILLFPDSDTLRVVLQARLVPDDVSLAPATVTHDSQGRIYLEPAVSLSRTTAKHLDRLGVKGSKRHASESTQQVGTWLEVVPLVRDTSPPRLSSQCVVLFELESPDELPAIATEMLRLGNDRQGMRWFAPRADSTAVRVLLRVIGPPYYTLLRALDKSVSDKAGGIRAFLEPVTGSNVWVEVGYSHPFASQIRAPAEQLLLIRQPGEWEYLPEAPFHDLYEHLQFKLPATTVGWSDAGTNAKMIVPLRLIAGNAADVPELWILRENAVQQLDTLVRDAEDRLTQRLIFAVATDPSGAHTVVLRTRPSKLTPPVLQLENAIGFKPFWKLPNLYIPAGSRLHPTLRRDSVRRLLANDADQVVWLYPDGSGGFTPETIPDAAFRPLEDWVDYVIEADQKPLAAWIEATRFDFDHYVCSDTGGPKPRPDRSDREPRTPDSGGKPLAKPDGSPRSAPRAKPTARPGAPAELVALPVEEKAPGEWERLKLELEEKFQAIDGPLDAPERQALWPELARAYIGVGKAADDAALSWLNAIWDADPIPGEWLQSWVRSEYHTDGSLRAEDLDRRLHSKTESVTDARAVVAGFLRLSFLNPVPGWLTTRLPAIQKYLEVHEQSLPVRAVWLAAFRLAQLAGADVLGLARVRDRLLQRLLDQGLQPERDLPSFLRFAGLKDSERLRLVRTRAQDLHQSVRRWIEKGAEAQRNDPLRRNLAFVDLLFAFALARLGETASAKRLLDDARKEMVKPAPTGQPDNNTFDAFVGAITSTFLFKAYQYRIAQCIAGKPHFGSLSAELLEELQELSRKSALTPSTERGGQAAPQNPYVRAEYVIGRLRQQSHILEPQERTEPYAVVTQHSDALRRDLVAIASLRDPVQLADRIRRRFREGCPGHALKDVQFRVLHEAIPLSTRVGEAFCTELLAHVPAALAGGLSGPETTELPKLQGELLERAIFHAAHFDRVDLVQKLVAQFVDLVHSKPDVTRFKLVNAVGGQALRSLRKLGLRDEIDRLLSRLQSEVLQGKSLPELRKKYAAKPENWAAVLQTLLNLAAGWLTFGLADHASPVLEEARTELLSPAGLKLPPKDYTELARAYVQALGQGSSDSGLPLITELFDKMDPTKINNTWTTAPFYSRLHLNLVEEVILALVSDEFALGPAGRRWLDEDEYLVRRRIHGDMRRHLEKARL